MNLVDVLGAPEQRRTAFSAKVTGLATGRVTVALSGGSVSARYIGAKPAVNDIVLVVYVADEPVCIGKFGTT